MPRYTHFGSFIIWGKDTFILFFDMKGTVGFIGVFLSFLSEISGRQLQFPCSSDPNCYNVCKFCEDHYGKPSMECLSYLFDDYLHLFSEKMRSLNSTDWCIWDKVSSFYSDFSTYTETLSDCLLIPWPNSLVEKLFVNIHSEYFKTCPTEEFSDPPPGIVFALVITPICLIPVMVSLVVIKTKNGDGTS